MKLNTRSAVNFLIATCFGVGKLPAYLSYASASLLAIPVSFILYQLAAIIAPYFFMESSPWHYLMIVLMLFVILSYVAILASDGYAKDVGKKDPASVVIDEVVGQTLAFILTMPWTILVIYFSDTPRRFLSESNHAVFLIAVALNICLFRLFDWLKPWPIRRLERLKGGFGIVLDDIGAGIMTVVVYWLIMLSVNSPI
jgi:phosphatidylglycerophosphatase A